MLQIYRKTVYECDFGHWLRGTGARVPITCRSEGHSAHAGSPICESVEPGEGKMGWLGGAFGKARRPHSCRGPRTLPSVHKVALLSSTAATATFVLFQPWVGRGSNTTQRCSAPQGHTTPCSLHARLMDGKRIWQMEGLGGGGVTSLVSSWPRYRVLGSSHGWMDGRIGCREMLEAQDSEAGRSR